jgi:putative transposase
MTSTNAASPNNFSYIGFQHYSLTWSCYHRHRLFTQRDRVDLVRSQFLRASEESDVEDVAYCFMADHVHQLVKGNSPTADAKHYIRKARQYSGFHFKRQYGVRLWQDGPGFNRVLLDGFDVRTAVGYVIENPVRAGFVDKVEDYPFTGSSKHTMNELLEMAYGF